MENKENCIEFLCGTKIATLTLTSKKHITKVKKLNEENPTEVDYVENKDGSIYAKIPISYIKLTGPRKLSNEQKEAAARRIKKVIHQ